MIERSEAQKAADRFREGLREAIQRLPRGVVVEVSTAAEQTSGNDPFDRRSLTSVGMGLLPDVEMIAAHIGTDGHGWADLRVGLREVRALLFVNVDEVEPRGVTLDETQTEWLGMMDDVRRWARGVRLHEVERVAQESWAKQVEAESAAEAGRGQAVRDAVEAAWPGVAWLVQPHVYNGWSAILASVQMQPALHHRPGGWGDLCWNPDADPVLGRLEWRCCSQHCDTFGASPGEAVEKVLFLLPAEDAAAFRAALGVTP